MKIKSWNLARKRHSKANSKIAFRFEGQLLDHAFARVSPDLALRAFASKLQHCDPRAINSPLLTFSLHPARVCRAGNEIVSDAPCRVSFTYSSPPGRCTRGCAVRSWFDLHFQHGAEDQSCPRGDGCGDWYR